VDDSNVVGHWRVLVYQPTCLALARAVPTGKSFFGFGTMTVIDPSGTRGVSQPRRSAQNFVPEGGRQSFCYLIPCANCYKSQLTDSEKAIEPSEAGDKTQSQKNYHVKDFCHFVHEKVSFAKFSDNVILDDFSFANTKRKRRAIIV
jgi:hypothetical protein